MNYNIHREHIRITDSLWFQQNHDQLSSNYNKPPSNNFRIQLLQIILICCETLLHSPSNIFNIISHSTEYADGRGQIAATSISHIAGGENNPSHTFYPANDSKMIQHGEFRDDLLHVLFYVFTSVSLYRDALRHFSAPTNYNQTQFNSIFCSFLY